MKRRVTGNRAMIMVLVCLLTTVSISVFPFETSAHNEKSIIVTFINNDQFIIDDGIGPVIYTDVIQEPDISNPVPDIILITHDHFDHFDPNIVEQMANSYGATVVGPNPVIDALEGTVPSGQLVRMDPPLYERMNRTILGVEIFAYHGSVDNNSYRFTVGSGVVSLFHSGDNFQGDFEEYISNGYSELYNLDIAMLANWFDLDSFNSSYQPGVMIEMHLNDQCNVYEYYPDYITLYTEDSWIYQHISFIDITSGNTPSIDGTISPGEWDDANSVMFFNDQGEINIYFKHDNERLYFMSNITDSTNYWGDDIVIGIDTNHDGGSDPQTDDYQFYIMREVSNSEIRRGTGSGWETVPDEEWAGHVKNETSSGLETWTAEISISYNFLNIYDDSQILGIGFRSYDDDPQGWYNWPADGEEDNPSTWAELQSSDNWGLEDSSNVLYVGGTGPGNYTQIQDAINDATGGDTVFVFDDSAPYYENVIVNKSIDLIGEDKDLTIIDGGGGGDVVTITADMVNMTGFTVRNDGTGFESTCLMVESNDVIIKGNVISDSNIGIYSVSTNNILIANNSISSDLNAGIILANSVNAMITGNEMINCGISVMGDILDQWNSHAIETSNTVNGAPVLYWKDKNDGTVPQGQGQVILANCNNVIVENQFFEQVYTGCELGFSSNNLIANNSLSNNGIGAFIFSSNGNDIINNTVTSSLFVNIGIRNSDNNLISDNQIQTCQWLEGIQMSDSNGNTFLENTISNNDGGAAWLITCQSNKFINNTISSNTDHGLYLSDSSHGNEIRGNMISSNTLHGLYILDSDGSYVYDNDVSNNDIDGILLENSHNSDIKKNVMTQNGFFGMSFLHSDNNLLADSDLSSNNYYGLEIEYSWQNDIVNNTFGNNERGIYIKGASLFNNIFYNNITGNTEHGIYIYSSSPVNNVIYNNNFFDNAQQAQDDTDNGNMWDNGYPTGGNYWNDYTGVDEYSGEDQNQPGADGIGDTDYVIDTNSIDHYPLMGPFGTTKGSIYNMDKDLYYYKVQEAIDDADSGNSIYISNGTYYENIVVDRTLNLIGEDMENVKIIGATNGDVLHITAPWVNITGLKIIYDKSNNDESSIRLESDHNALIGNNITSTYSRGRGLYLVNSLGNSIVNNSINFLSSGLSLYYSDGNSIKNNTIWDTQFGVSFDTSHGNDFSYNRILDNSNTGISLFQSTGNEITENVIDMSRDYGIKLENSDGNTFSGNTISNNPFGIYLERSEYSIITNNIMIENGIFIESYVIEDWNTHEIHTSNTVNGKPVYYWKGENGGIIPPGAGQVILANCNDIRIENQELSLCSAGLQLGFSSNIIITGIMATDNEYGFSIVHSDLNLFSLNNVSNNEVGMYFRFSDDCNITQNIVSQNTDYGIHTMICTGNDINNNTISANEDCGVFISSGNSNRIVNNNISSNRIGVDISSSNNEVIGNEIYLNVRYGIELRFTSGDKIIDNLVISEDFAQGSISLYYSDDCIVKHNTIIRGGRGIDLRLSHRNNVSYNDMEECDYGFYSIYSNESHIFHNNISSNDQYGLYITSSSSNRIFGNNIMNNTNQAFDDGNDNYWDNGYPEGGNFWNDYIGSDEYSGANQDQQGPDGLGDNPYTNIDGGTGAQDYYPLMNLYYMNKGPVHNIDINKFYYKIQDAIDDSETLEGHTINVPSGIYYENIVVNKSLNLVGEDRDITMIDGGGMYDCIWITADFVNASGFNVSNTGTEAYDAGFHVDGKYATIYNNTIYSCQKGIVLNYSAGNTIRDNEISGNFVGIHNWQSEFSSIINNVISQSEMFGIYSVGSPNTDITGNSISSNRYAAELRTSSDSVISNNVVLFNEKRGIQVSLSENMRIENNLFTNNGIIIDGNSQSYWDTHTIANNYANDRPIYYYKNVNGLTVPEDAIEVILAGCSDVTISGINASNVDIGILLGFCSSNLIVNNKITFNNEDGIILLQSEDNRISNNNISYCGNGINMEYSHHNTISENEISNNYEGIHFTWNSYNNTISGNHLFSNDRAMRFGMSSSINRIYNNEIYDNLVGIVIDSMPPFYTKGNIIFNNNFSYNNRAIRLESTSDNRIYQNNFIDNLYQVSDDKDDNQWDNGYPSGGNYWSDYSGSDFFSGPNQDQSESDGIGDVPYEIDSDSMDNYPLMIPWMPDETPPIIELLSPSNNSIIRPGTSILFSITDESILTVTYSVDQGSHQTLEPPYEIDTSQMNEGIFTVEVQAIDIYDNSIGKSYIFTVDTDSPEVSLVSPGNNSYITAGIPIIFTAFDQHLDKVICSVEGSAPQELNEPYELETDGWNDGNYEVLLNASDLAGNFKLGYYNFTIDSTHPEIMLISPRNNSFLSENLDLSFIIFEDNILTSKYSKNKGSWVSFSEPYQIEMEKWDDGEYLIDIRVEDMAGNKVKKWFVFTKDTIGPNIILNSPENNTMILEDSSIDFNIEEENLNSVVYSVNQGIFNTLIEPYDLDISSWEDGEYTITIRAEDHAGITIERWFIFRIDTEIPSIAMTFPLSDSDDIIVDIIILIDFSESMDTDSVENAITISPYTEYSLQWENDNSTLMITFAESLEYNTPYMVSVSKKAEDMAGRGLDNKFELEFTTQVKPKIGNGDGLPVVFLILTLSIAGLAAIIIVVFVVAKKRKAPGKVGSEGLHAKVESSNTIQFTCSKCNNLLQAIDNGLTQNVSCPYCSTLLTVRSQRGAASTPQAQPPSLYQQSTVQISCPQCKHSFNVNNTGGPTSIKCPNCGLSGTVNMGGTAPQKPSSTSMPSQQIRCPGCQKLFNIQTGPRPIAIQCPHCGISGTLN